MAAALKTWKRKTEEHGNDPAEPTTGKRQRESSPVAPSAENDQVTAEPLIIHGARELNYVKEVKETFKDEEESYHKFLELMEDARLKHVDHDGLVSRLTELFKDHTNLIRRFNTFLPENRQITLPSMERPEILMKEQGIMFKRRVEALGMSKHKEFCEILALFQERSNTIDYVYKLAETLFADHDDLLADFRSFLPFLEASDSEMSTEEPDQQPALDSWRKVNFVHPSANVSEEEAPADSSRLAEISRKGKEKMETANSKEVARKLRERTSNPEEDDRTKTTQARELARMHACTAARRPQVPMAPRTAAAAGSLRPASDQRKSARTAAKSPSLLPSEDANPVPQAPLPPVPYNNPELQERLRNVSKCCPDCKACEYVEYPIFDWQAEDPEYYAKGKANRERERQALIARGVPGSFNDS